jgi:putative membrane protein
MKQRAMAIFSDEDKQRIEARIAEAEKKTAAEFVVATTPRSDDYLDVRLIAALCFGFGASAAMHLALPLVGAGELFALQLVLGLLSFWLSGVPGVLRRLPSTQRIEREAAREAEVRFLEHSVFETRDRTGVLILLSELEHNVTILGDKGIHARVRDAGWEQHVATIVAAIRAGKAADGVCQVIDQLSALLAHTAPVQSDDTDELENRVRDGR